MATCSLREALHDPLGNVLVFTREEETPIRLQLSLFEKAPGLKCFFLNPNYQRRMQRRHKFLQNGRPAGIEYILDLVPPLEGEEAVDAVEDMYCPPSVQRWKCPLEGWMDAKQPWVEDDDGGQYWLQKSDRELALDRFRANYEVDMKKKIEAEELAAEKAIVLALHQEEMKKEEALHQEQSENAPMDVEGGNWHDEDTLARPPMFATLPLTGEVRQKLTSEAEKQPDTFLDILLRAIEKSEETDSPTATWTQTAGQPGPAILATGYQFGEPPQSFGAPGTPRPRRLSGSSSASSVTAVPQATFPPGERDFQKDLETAKAISSECQQSVARTLSPVEETIPPAYSRARHSGAIERILAIMCGEDPHIYSAPMWYTIYRIARTLSCEALVVDHILRWLYASPGFIEFFTPLCVQIATDLRAPALYRECFALCVAREISSSTPLHPVNLADFPELTRLAVAIASASFKKRLDQTWEYLISLEWLDELAQFPKLHPDDAKSIKFYLKCRFNALMEEDIGCQHDTPFAPPAPHPSVPLEIYNTWRRGVNNECAPQIRHYNAYIWLQIRDLRWERYEMADFGLDGAIKHKLRAIADDVLHNELSDPSDFMMLLGLDDEQWACMPAWARGEDEETTQLEVREGRESSEIGEREFECGSEPSDLGKFECGSEPSDLARSVETESWGEVSEVGSVLTLCESTKGMDEKDVVEGVDEVAEEIEDLGMEEDDGWDTDMTISWWRGN